MFAAKHGIEHAAVSFEQVMADPEVHSISIATPHFLHAPMALAALKSGKHALIEKPFAMTPNDGKTIIATAAERPQIVVLPVSQHRFDPVVRTVAQLVLKGMLGTVLLVRAHLECFRAVEYYTESKWRGKWQTEGGSVLINQAYHIIDMMLWLAGPISSVSAHMETKRYRDVIETEETVTTSFSFASGALGGLTICGAAGDSWNSYFEIVGTAGVVAFDLSYPNVVHRLRLTDRRELLNAKKALNEIAKKRELPPAALDYYGTSHRGQAIAFVEAIRTGSFDAYMANLCQAESAVQTIDTIYRAARSGQKIELLRPC
jgi:UDP-N-acetyl-2-amino-2-deoxyglucuronate dehydrogenase